MSNNNFTGKVLSIKINYFALCLLFFSGSSCQAQADLKKTANDYIQARLEDSVRFDLYSKLFKAGKDAIPVLINEIDRDEKSEFGEKKDLNSSFINPRHKDYVGLWAMHLIEHIQKGSTYGDPDRIIEIVTYKSPKLDYANIKELKALYQKWWDLNKYKSLAELADDWKRDKRPLTGSFYFWK